MHFLRNIANFNFYLGINIDVKQRTIDDAHSLRDSSAQKMKQEKKGRNTH